MTLRASTRRRMVTGLLTEQSSGRYGPLDAAVLPVYKNIILADSPLGYWVLNDASGLPVDSSGNGNDMSSTDGTPDYRYIRGPFYNNQSLHYGGGEAHYRAAVSTATNNMTMEGWVYPYVVTVNSQTMFLQSGSGNGWDLLVNIDLGIQGIAQGIAFLGASAGKLSARKWNHVAIMRDAGTWKYFINGSQDSSTPGSTAPSTPSSGSTGTGKAAVSGGRDIAYAHLAVYDSALSAAKISTRYLAVKRGVRGVGIA